MAVESSTDRADMLGDWDTFTVDGVSVSGVFGREYVEVNGMESYSPVFTCQTADVAHAAIGDVATSESDGVNYTIRSIQPDGTGISALVLEVN